LKITEKLSECFNFYYVQDGMSSDRMGALACFLLQGSISF